MKNHRLKTPAFLLLFVLLFSKAVCAQIIDSTSLLFNIDTVATKLGYPWEITYGPDDSLWITEARGYRVVRVSASRTGAAKNAPPQQVLKIPLNSASGASGATFGRTIGTWPQGGMQGLAIHPEFMTNSNKRWVYLSYVYKGSCAANPSSPCYFRTKIVRCRFYFAADAGNPCMPAKDTLTIMDTIISNLPGSNDHNSGRMTISPQPETDGTYKLYYTIGDMGAGQFNNASRINQAQSPDTCEGKILRLNTEPDGDPSFGVNHDYNTWRQWIPNDNPFYHSDPEFNTLKTPIYSYGHRNAQGLVWGNVNSTWRLYSSEHGDKSDDEVNIIQAGKNYGWPKVAGMPDDNYSSTDAFANNNKLASQNVSWSELTWSNANSAQRPVFSLFNSVPSAIPADAIDNYEWPTIAPSSIDFYKGYIPGWKNSLLVPSLKLGMYRLKLNSAGTFIDSSCSSNIVDTFPLLHGWRVRDIAINPVVTSGVFWVVMDSSGNTSGPTGGFDSDAKANTKDGGKILKLSYKVLITLPVKFISFSGVLTQLNTVDLQWQAVTDEMQGYFEIEKATAGLGFVPIGKVNANAPYQFTDTSPAAGNNYYRVKQYDADGHFTYSQTILVFYNPVRFSMTLYPAPAKESVTLKMIAAKTERMTVLVTDQSGRVVYSSAAIINAGNNEWTINTSSFASGIYILGIKNNAGVLLGVQKFSRQ